MLKEMGVWHQMLMDDTGFKMGEKISDCRGDGDGVGYGATGQDLVTASDMEHFS